MKKRRRQKERRKEKEEKKKERNKESEKKDNNMGKLSLPYHLLPFHSILTMYISYLPLHTISTQIYLSFSTIIIHIIWENN